MNLEGNWQKNQLIKTHDNANRDNQKRLACLTNDFPNGKIFLKYWGLV